MANRMDELCPLCLKMGLNRKIKAVQINLEEAVWMCENEECPWPFGHETPNFLQRKVGVKWAYEWETYKKVQKRVGPIPVCAELCLYTPPVTPSSEASSKDSVKSDCFSGSTISESSGHGDKIFSGNTKLDDSDGSRSNPLEENTARNELSQICNSKNIVDTWKMGGEFEQPVSPIPSIFDIDGDELLSNKLMSKELSPQMETIDSSLKNSDILDVRESGIEDIATVLEKIEVPVVQSKNCMKSVEKMVSKVEKESSSKQKPRVVSVTKTNIDIKILDCEKAQANRVVEEDLSKTSKSILGDETALSIEKQSSRDNLCASKCQHTTTINVDGALPITLSYDLAILKEKSIDPSPSTSTPNRRHSKEQSLSPQNPQGLDRTGKMVNSSPKHSRASAKRRIALVGKQYEKFNFNSVKKFASESKSAENHSDKIASSQGQKNENAKLEKVMYSEEKSSITDPRIDPPDKIPSAMDQSSIDESVIPEIVDRNHSEISDGVDSLNLSGVLNDLLMDDCQNVTENLNDDWLKSFFT